MSGNEPDSAPAIPQHGIVPGGWQHREGEDHHSGKGNAWIANAAGGELGVASRTKASVSKPRNRAILLQHCMPRWHVHLGRDHLLAVRPGQGIANLWGALQSQSEVTI